MSVEGFTTQAPPELVALRARIDLTLERFLSEIREEMFAVAPDALLPVDEVRRLIAAGGKRLRPAFCYWGFRAAGGPDGEAIERAASALELLHTMALIHDDVMDRSTERRGVRASAVHLMDQAPRGGWTDPEHMGMSLALLTGDLAVVLADRLFLTAGFEPRRLIAALDQYHRMRTEMALGQYMDLVGDVGDATSVATLKGGSYTVEGPLLVGAALAGADPAALAALRDVGRPLGLAFQLLDDERDGDVASPSGQVPGLITRARSALKAPSLDPVAVPALHGLVDLVESG